MTDDDLKHRRLVDKTKKEKALSKGYNFLEIKNLTTMRIDKLIKILESSTTIENLKDIKLREVEYTQASGNGKLLLE